MRVCIAGSRSITDQGTLDRVMDKVQDDLAKAGILCPLPSEIVSGAATGVDQLGLIWAEKHRVPTKIFTANWEAFGKSAGPLRNREMAHYMDTFGDCVLVALWDGESRGTLHMIKYCHKLGIPVFVYDQHGVWIHDDKWNRGREP